MQHRFPEDFYFLIYNAVHSGETDKFRWNILPPSSGSRSETSNKPERTRQQAVQVSWIRHIKMDLTFLHRLIFLHRVQFRFYFVSSDSSVVTDTLIYPLLNQNTFTVDDDTILTPPTTFLRSHLNLYS
jgi:hypothetical protein